MPTMTKEHWWDRNGPWYVIAFVAVYFACRIVVAIFRETL